MPKGSGLTNRNFGLNHTNGKGDASRITDVKAYRENFDEINWGPKLTFKRVRKLAKKLSALVRKEDSSLRSDQSRLRTLREIEDEEFAWRHGL